MSFGDASAHGLQGVDPALQQFILNETEKQKLQVKMLKQKPLISLFCFLVLEQILHEKFHSSLKMLESLRRKTKEC